MAKGEVKGDRIVLTNFTEHTGGSGAAGKAAVLKVHQEVPGSSFEGRNTSTMGLSFKCKILKS